MRKFLMAAAATVLMAVPANAVIVTGSVAGGTIQSNGGTFEVASFTDITVNTINSKNVIGVNEAFAYTLTNDLRVFNINVGAGVTPSGQTGSILISAGTKVASHLIFIDPTDANINNGGGGNSAAGTVTFNNKVLGYIFDQTANANGRGGANFTATNYLGAPGTTYGALGSTLEGGIDAVSISGNTITFAMESPRLGGDYLRVITAVPEPATWAMLLTGFGLVGFAARRRRAVVAA